MADVDVPKVGKMNKKILFPIIAVAAGFIGWKYYKSRTAVAAAAPGDPGYVDPGTLPPVAGAVLPGGNYGSGTSTNNQPSGDRPITNAQWTQLAVSQLTTGDGRWSASDILVALGNYLGGQPLSTTQQEIVRAARAAAGEPPEGYHVIVPGGNTPLKVAPTGVSATATPTAIKVSFAPVPGAVTYNVYRSNTTNSGAPSGTGSNSPVDLVGLTPNTSYTVQVAGVTAAGAVGPKSTAIKVKTAGVTIGTPAKPTVTGITSSSATLTTNPVPYANSYHWWVSGRLVHVGDGPVWTATGMRSKTRYTATVAADTTTGSPSKQSPVASFTTK